MSAVKAGSSAMRRKAWRANIQRRGLLRRGGPAPRARSSVTNEKIISLVNIGNIRKIFSFLTIFNMLQTYSFITCNVLNSIFRSNVSVKV